MFSPKVACKIASRPGTLAMPQFYVVAGNEDFMQNDVRVKKDLDGLGCLGDLGWYSVRYALWAYGFEKPIEVAAHSGVQSQLPHS